MMCTPTAASCLTTARHHGTPYGTAGALLPVGSFAGRLVGNGDVVLQVRHQSAVELYHRFLSLDFKCGPFTGAGDHCGNPAANEVGIHPAVHGPAIRGPKEHSRSHSCVDAGSRLYYLATAENFGRRLGADGITRKEKCIGTVHCTAACEVELPANIPMGNAGRCSDGETIRNDSTLFARLENSAPSVGGWVESPVKVLLNTCHSRSLLERGARLGGFGCERLLEQHVSCLR